MVETLKLRMTFRLSPTQGDIMHMLMANDVVRSREISQANKVTIHHLRNILRGHNIAIRSQQRLGYWMEKEDKDRVSALLDGVLPGQGETAGCSPNPDQPDTASEHPVAGS